MELWRTAECLVHRSLVGTKIKIYQIDRAFWADFSPCLPSRRAPQLSIILKVYARVINLHLRPWFTTFSWDNVIVFDLEWLQRLRSLTTISSGITALLSSDENCVTDLIMQNKLCFSDKQQDILNRIHACSNEKFFFFDLICMKPQQTLMFIIYLRLSSDLPHLLKSVHGENRGLGQPCNPHRGLFNHLNFSLRRNVRKLRSISSLRRVLNGRFRWGYCVSLQVQLVCQGWICMSDFLCGNKFQRKKDMNSGE
jgi:hypothetical protein